MRTKEHGYARMCETKTSGKRWDSNTFFLQYQFPDFFTISQIDRNSVCLRNRYRGFMRRFHLKLHLPEEERLPLCNPSSQQGGAGTFRANLRCFQIVTIQGFTLRPFCQWLLCSKRCRGHNHKCGHDVLYFALRKKSKISQFLFLVEFNVKRNLLLWANTKAPKTKTLNNFL